MKKTHITLVAGLMAVTAFWSCGDGGKKTPVAPASPTPAPTTETPLKAYVAPPAFNADSAHAFVAKQVAFGPRIPNTPAQKKCADWLEAKLRGYAKEVIVQSAKVNAYTGEELQMYNIIARFKPENTNRILLFAHWDTRPWSDQDANNAKGKLDGADDGGSGAGVLLEVARIISQTPPDAGVDIILFDTEDYGAKENYPNSYCLGSQYWGQNPPIPGYYAKYGILLDMVGAKGAKFAKEGFSVSKAPSVVEKVWSTAGKLGYGQYFTDEITQGVTDDHVYVYKYTGIPCIDIINHGKHNIADEDDSGFGKHWHTQRDNLNNIDKNVLKAVGQTLLDVLYNE